MGEMRADEDEVAGGEGLDAVADEAGAAAGDDEGEFVLGVVVPGGIEGGQGEGAHREGGGGFDDNLLGGGAGN
jgi:hypothetical protein